MHIKENLQKRAESLKTDIPAVWLALKDRETPLLAKLLAGLAVCYALSPVDLIPDFIPVLGYLDDLLLLPALVALTIRLIPKPVMQRCRERAAGMWENGKPQKWYYAIPVVAVILLILWVILCAVF